VRQKKICILYSKQKIFYHGTNTSRTFSESRNVNRKENKYGAHNYHPLPVVLDRERRGFVWDGR
jgi:hypothetical protein